MRLVLPLAQEPARGPKKPQDAQKPLHRVASCGPMLVTGLPANLWAVVVSTAPVAGFPDRFSLLRAASLAVALAGRLLFSLANRIPVAGTSLAPSYIAIVVPFSLIFAFNNLQSPALRPCLQSRSLSASNLQKTIELTALPLTLRAVMGAPSPHHNPPDRRLAASAGLARTPVDAMFQLEKSPHSLRVHIV